MPRMILSDLPPRYQNQVAAQIIPGAPGQIMSMAAVQPTADAAFVRQSHAKPNKLEQRFGAWLCERYAQHHVYEQEITLSIGNGVRYTPDFFVPSVEHLPFPAVAIAYETKGFARDDAIVKIKVAAHQHRWCQFYLVKADKKNGWAMQLIEP